LDFPEEIGWVYTKKIPEVLGETGRRVESYSIEDLGDIGIALTEHSGRLF
jgi:hypothetical protein